MMQQKVAKDYMDKIGADFIITGEVAGQRAKSQKKQDLKYIWETLEFGDIVVRPLSAKILPPTLPEREGWIDREKLYDIHGRQREVQMQLAEEFDITYPNPAGGCMLTEKILGARVKESIDYKDSLNQELNSLDFDTLWWGRHYRLEDGNKIIVARDMYEGERFAKVYEENSKNTSFVSLKSGKGPVAIILFNTDGLTEDLKEVTAFLISNHFKDKTDRDFIFNLYNKDIEYNAGEFIEYKKQPIKVVNSYHIKTGVYKEIL